MRTSLAGWARDSIKSVSDLRSPLDSKICIKLIILILNKRFWFYCFKKSNLLFVDILHKSQDPANHFYDVLAWWKTIYGLCLTIVCCIFFYDSTEHQKIFCLLFASTECCSRKEIDQKIWQLKGSRYWKLFYLRIETYILMHPNQKLNPK